MCGRRRLLPRVLLIRALYSVPDVEISEFHAYHPSLHPAARCPTGAIGRPKLSGQYVGAVEIAMQEDARGGRHTQPTPHHLHTMMTGGNCAF